MIESDDPAVLARKLAELRLEHRDLDAAIDRLAVAADADELTVKRLKKRRLWLKDCIARLESALIPDEPA
ncbi:YdcH family protein [Lysobacter sp. LF1]|uniref:YdcH family protein n=1 Tax=Lysobacter stagni TaxID=3045172 RepID=A0ABT6XDH8_9GAMM|nr:YdcH family protein [Lysobacter sp. LF1]MDI9238191.1 YdcH family protein [Lysobacter sp. LF1]